MLMNSNEYITVVDTIKKEIRSAQYRTAVQANTELLRLYYSIGKEINVHKVWGNKFIENLSMDIRADYPTNKGFSVRNLKYMAKFAATYSEQEFVQQTVAQIPWGHNIVLLDKITDSEQRRWYAETCQKNGWSRNVLIHQIESGLYERQVLNSKVSNFKQRLPSPQSELATQTMKDPYVFDFIPFREDMLERDIEQALVRDVTKLLLELGTGFAFLGNQYHLNVGGDDFYIDLLFYNLNLRCYVVVELKTGEFKPEYAGQLNFYLSAVDGILKKDADNPSIGLLLCKSKNNLVAEYSLKDIIINQQITVGVVFPVGQIAAVPESARHRREQIVDTLKVNQCRVSSLTVGNPLSVFHYMLVAVAKVKRVAIASFHFHRTLLSAVGWRTFLSAQAKYVTMDPLRL